MKFAKTIWRNSATKCFSLLGINITRVSYNKAVDSHTLFIDAEGTEEQLKRADTELEKIGYLQSNASKTSIVLIEFCLSDVPGSVTNVLQLINEFNFNISYISSQENGTDYQYFKMGLSEEVSRELLVHVNLAMQTLDEQGLSPYRTFDSINKFAELLGASKGKNFNPRISTHKVTENTEITLIEPPCGSNTIIIKSNDKVLFVDSGKSLVHMVLRRIILLINKLC